MMSVIVLTILHCRRIEPIQLWNTSQFMEEQKLLESSLKAMEKQNL